MPGKTPTKSSSRTRKTTRSSSPPPGQLPLTEHKLRSRRDDLHLIHGALRGNQGAYKKLMKKYREQIFHLITRIIRDREQVADLTQETFVKAFASLKNFNEEYAFSTWLYKIATNSSIDFIRKKKLDTLSIDKPIAMEDSDYSFQLADTTYQPDKKIMQTQRTRLIEEAIEQLPEKYKRVIVLRHTEDRDYAEIAKMLKLPIGTVKAHIFRARELLNKYLRSKIGHY